MQRKLKYIRGQAKFAYPKLPKGVSDAITFNALIFTAEGLCNAL